MLAASLRWRERRDLPSQQRFIADRRFRHCLLKTLNSDFSQVQPASVIGCVVKLQRLAMRRASDGANAS